MTLLPVWKVEGDAKERVEHLVRQTKRPKAMLADMGRRVVKVLRQHFADLDAKNPNKLGGAREHFWNDVRESVLDAEADDQKVTVGIAHPAILQKLHGGTITGDGKRLTIPATAEAYGKRAGFFSDLKLAVLGKQAALMRGDKVYYWLVKSVTQKPFPETLPDNSELSDAVEDTGRKHLRRIMKGGR